jgi:hypothetical protein
MPNHPLPLFRLSELAIPPTPRSLRRPGATASRRLRRLLAAASANEIPDASERALVLDLHAHLRHVGRVD